MPCWKACKKYIPKNELSSKYINRLSFEIVILLYLVISLFPKGSSHSVSLMLLPMMIWIFPPIYCFFWPSVLQSYLKYFYYIHTNACTCYFLLHWVTAVLLCLSVLILKSNSKWLEVTQILNQYLKHGFISHKIIWCSMTCFFC